MVFWTFLSLFTIIIHNINHISDVIILTKILTLLKVFHMKLLFYSNDYKTNFKAPSSSPPYIVDPRGENL